METRGKYNMYSHNQILGFIGSKLPDLLCTIFELPRPQTDKVTELRGTFRALRTIY